MSRLSSDRGFTLMELVVSTAVGSIVMLGAFTLIDQAMPATNRVADRTIAQARGRAALERVVQELRSVMCVPQSNGSSFWPPFDVTSDNSQVTFYTQMFGDPTGMTGPTGPTGPDPAITNTLQPEKRVLRFTGTDLVEDRYTGQFNNPTPGNWGFPLLSSSRIVLTNVQQSGATPYFKYYAPDAPSTPLATPISAADKPRIFRVEVTFFAGPGKTGVRGTDAYAALTGSATVQIPVDFTDATTTAKGPQCSF